jgi:hypothetical protein
MADPPIPVPLLGADQLDKDTMDILRQVREYLEQMPERRMKPSNPMPVQVDSAAIECVCCLLPIEKGHFFLSMPCCGAMCHVICMARIANGHSFSVAHACQHCQSDLSPDFTGAIIRMWRIIESFGRAAEG